MDFSRDKAIVTGAASGIGLSVVEALVARGAAVMCVDRDQQGLDQLRSRFPGVRTSVTDITHEAAVQAMVDGTLAELGGLSVLIHSAGVGIERAFLDTGLNDWNRLIQINLTGAFLVGQAAARPMAAAGYGRIVHMASTAGIRGGTGRAAYGASKGGLIALTRVMAVELAEAGVTVNALAPGPIETEMVARMHSPQTRRVYTAAVPMNRYGTPAEVAAAALFLASRDAAYVTGQILGVDGGFLAAGVMAR
jgi:NAD(P)-dependent dehydrogenase (short-subunit alcohol dehydrogenase family)